MTRGKDSEAQELADRLKDEAWAEVAHLPLEEALAERLRIAARAVRESGLKIPVRDPRIPVPATLPGDK